MHEIGMSPACSLGCTYAPNPIGLLGRGPCVARQSLSIHSRVMTVAACIIGMLGSMLLGMRRGSQSGLPNIQTWDLATQFLAHPDMKRGPDDYGQHCGLELHIERHPARHWASTLVPTFIAPSATIPAATHRTKVMKAELTLLAPGDARDPAERRTT